MKKTITLTDDQVVAVLAALKCEAGLVNEFLQIPGLGADSLELYDRHIRTVEEVRQTITAAAWEY